jgi:signal transduction histidine kinase/CheY-like chemotaxis protein
MILKKTYSKILLMIISSSVFFTILYLSLYCHTLQLEKQFYVNSTKQFEEEVNKLLILDSKPISVAINNDANWDELVSFITTKDSHWFNETITSELGVYNADYFGVYGVDKKIIIHSATAPMKSIDFIPKQAMDKLDELGSQRFYMKLPEGIIEVHGASIHHSKDILKRKSNSFGYFFVVRNLDQYFLKTLEKLTRSKIKMVSLSSFDKVDEHWVYAKIDLKNARNESIARLVFRRNFDLYLENTMNILYVIIIAFFINLVVILIYSRRWVNYPLDLITQILETGNKKSIKELQATPGEFKYIGNLFEENSIQREQLEKAKEKAEESDSLKTSFLTNLSHEIRTPMNAILGFADLLNGKELSDKERSEYLNVIRKSGTNLVSIIDDLIEMSKIDANQIVPNYSSVSLESCVDELFESIKITIPSSKKIDFYIIKNYNPKKYNVFTDEIKLKQIITNLITNAIKFTDQGSVAFGYEIDEEKAEVKFIVKDSGLGISKDKHRYIFERFKRIEGDLSIIAGGLGLGLAISKAYVEMLGGTITLESEIEKGSIFSFSFPLAINKINPIEELPICNRIFSNEEESRTILIAEDDNINFLLLKKILQFKKVSILRAKNGKEALDICIVNPNIDLILMDIKMPVMDGYEAFKKIKGFRPDLAIIAQTAYSSIEDKERIERMGFFGYITKPIHKEKLFDIIENAFIANNEIFFENKI